MRFCVLGSGSKGNCTFIEANGTRVLIDAGFSGIEVERRLAAIGVDTASIAAILVTHEHTDHVRGVAVLSRKYRIPVLANPATFEAADGVLSKLHARQEFDTGTPFTFQDLHVHPFSVSHDAADPVGFIMNDGKRCMGYCTDTGMVHRLMRHLLGNCHGLVLECNHDPELLKTGPYPQALKQRVRSKMGHLANIDAAIFLTEIIHEGLEHVVLSHLSETNNRPAVAHDTVLKVMKAVEYLGALPRISLASQEQIGELVVLKGGTVG